MNGMVARDKMFATLDEPTGNLDSINEAVILKVLRDEGAGRTVEVVWVCAMWYILFLALRLSARKNNIWRYSQWQCRFLIYF